LYTAHKNNNLVT